MCLSILIFWQTLGLCCTRSVMNIFSVQICLRNPQKITSLAKLMRRAVAHLVRREPKANTEPGRHVYLKQILFG